MTLNRREFGKAAVAIGGASALSACLNFAEEPIPKGSGVEALPDRQFAWNEFLRRDEHGNVELPRHQVLLYLRLPDGGPPTAAQRERVDAALSTLAEAFEWSSEGLVFSIGYSPYYFERFEEDLPEDIDLPEPRALASFEDPALDDHDALVHLASDRPDAVLAAEQALRGEREVINTVEATPLTGALELRDPDTGADRRTGFVGAGMPAERQSGLKGVPDSNPVPQASPLFMGFKAGFAGNQAPEGAVALESGPFAGGTTKVVANIRQRLDDWYEEQDFEAQVMEMFSPGHAEEGLVEGVGENLGSDSGVDRFVDDIEQQAREFGRVGHAQKAARANRDEDGTPLLLRRHFESTDGNVASLHFPSLQRRVTQFEEVRKAMNGQDITRVTPAVRPQVNNGILEYIFTRRRGNFLVPPRRHWALPTPRPE